MPLLAGNTATCAYCENKQTLPPHLLELLAKEEDIGIHADAALTEMEGEYSRIRNAQIGLFLFLLFPIPLYLVGVWMESPEFVRDVLEHGVASFFLIGIGALFVSPFIVVPTAWLYGMHRSKKRRFAHLPLGIAHVEEGALVADCAVCGARLCGGYTITDSCRHCGTESLLPLSMIEPHLQKKHKKVIRQRIDSHLPAEGIIGDTIGAQNELVPKFFYAYVGIVVVTLTIVAIIRG